MPDRHLLERVKDWLPYIFIFILLADNNQKSKQLTDCQNGRVADKEEDLQASRKINHKLLLEEADRRTRDSNGKINILVYPLNKPMNGGNDNNQLPAGR